MLCPPPSFHCLSFQPHQCLSFFSRYQDTLLSLFQCYLTLSECVCASQTSSNRSIYFILRSSTRRCCSPCHSLLDLVFKKASNSNSRTVILPAIRFIQTHQSDLVTLIGQVLIDQLNPSREAYTIACLYLRRHPVDPSAVPCHPLP